MTFSGNFDSGSLPRQRTSEQSDVPCSACSSWPGVRNFDGTLLCHCCADWAVQIEAEGGHWTEVLPEPDESELFPGWYKAALDRERLDQAYRELDEVLDA